MISVDWGHCLFAFDHSGISGICLRGSWVGNTWVSWDLFICFAPNSVYSYVFAGCPSVEMAPKVALTVHCDDSSHLLTWRSGVRFYQNVSMCYTVWLRKHGSPGGKKLIWNDRARNYSKENSVISTVFCSHRQSTHGICSIIQHLHCEFSPYTSLDGNHRKQNLSEFLWIYKPALALQTVLCFLSIEKCLMRIRTAVYCHLIPVRMAIIRKSTSNKSWRRCGEKGTLVHRW